MKINKGLRYMILLALASGITLGVSAQDSAKNKQKDIPSFELGTFYVYGNRYKNTSTLGGKINQELKKIPASIDIVTDKEIQKQGATSLSEALQYETGVLGNVMNSDPLQNKPMIRGFDLGNKGILLEGIKDFTNVDDVIRPDVYGLEKVEVLKGPASTFIGSGSPGGVINMKLKSPKKENFSEVETKIGSKHEKTFRFDTNEYNENKDMAIRIVGSISKKDLFIDNSTLQRTYISPSVFKQISDKTDLTIKTFYQRDLVDGSLAPAMFKDKYINIPNRKIDNFTYGIYPDNAFVGIPGWDKVKQKQWGLNFELNHKVNDYISLHQKGLIKKLTQMSHQTTGIYTYDFDNPEQSKLKRTGALIDTEAKTFALDQYIEFHKETGENKRDTIIGIDGRYENDINYQYVRGIKEDPTDKDYMRFLTPWSKDEIKDYLSGKKERIDPEDIASMDTISYWNHEYGLYAAHNEKHGKWNYSAGIRRASYVIHAERDEIERDKYWATTGQAGIVYELTDELLPYVHWNNSFEPVHAFDKDKKLLKPQTGRQFEVGLRYEPKNKPVKASIALFDLRERNVPKSVYKLKANGDPELDEYNDPKIDYYRSIGEVASRGLDLHVERTFDNDLTLKFNYNYLDSKITKSNKPDEINKKMYNAPEHTMSLRAEKVVKKYVDGNITVGLGMRYIGKRAQESMNYKYLPGVTLYDAQISFTRGNDSVKLNVNNLFNKKYFVSAGEQWRFPVLYPGAERSVFLSYTHKW